MKRKKQLTSITAPITSTNWSIALTENTCGKIAFQKHVQLSARERRALCSKRLLLVVLPLLQNCWCEEQNPGASCVNEGWIPCPCKISSPLQVVSRAQYLVPSRVSTLIYYKFKRKMPNEGPPVMHPAVGHKSHRGEAETGASKPGFAWGPAAPFPAAWQGAEGLWSCFSLQQPSESPYCGYLLLSVGALTCNHFQTLLGLVLYSLTLS